MRHTVTFTAAQFEALSGLRPYPPVDMATWLLQQARRAATLPSDPLTLRMTLHQWGRLKEAGLRPADGNLVAWLVKRAEHAAAMDEGAGRLADLMEALGVPEGVDAVEWAKRMKAAADKAVLWAGDSTGFANPALEKAALDYEALSPFAPPRPDAPGWWCGALRGEAPRPVKVVQEADFLAGQVYSGGGTWLNVHADDWSWLVKDGACVRFDVPEETTCDES